MSNFDVDMYLVIYRYAVTHTSVEPNIVNEITLNVGLYATLDEAQSVGYTLLQDEKTKIGTVEIIKLVKGETLPMEIIYEQINKANSIPMIPIVPSIPNEDDRPVNLPS